jgi:hypothetical protein
LLIFHHCDSAIRPRLVLTHTCRRWRLIAVNYRYLWTNFHFSTPHGVSDAGYERFESLLVLQSDRSGGLPLDIALCLNVGNRHIFRLLDSIQHKAPFSRWRSLQLTVFGQDPYVEHLLASVLGFPNLESLVISGLVEERLAAIFCRAAMPKLQKLHFKVHNYMFSADALIRLLNGGTLSLPDSVITLEAGIRSSHPFPNILNYTLEDCTFYSNGPIDLRSMTNLIIDGWLNVKGECDVLLPALQYLRCMNMWIEGKIEAPVLQTLHLSYRTDPNDPPQPHYANCVPMRYAVNTPGYRLSPKTLLIHEPYVPNGELIALLKTSRELTQATLCFSDQKAAQEVVETLFESVTKKAPLKERLCPQLAELMLDMWDDNTPLSAEQWLSGVEARKANSPMADVSVKARRKGGERYRLLAEW